MAKGQRFPKEFKTEVAGRIKGGEKPEDVAAEIKVHPDTVQNWVSKFGRKARVVKQKVSTNHRKPRPNALKLENENLKREVEFWKDAYMTEYRKNSLTSPRQ